MTKREFLNAIVESDLGEVSEFASAELVKMDEALARRKEKPSKAQIANAPIRAQILTIVSSDPLTATEVAAKLEGVTPAKAGSILRSLRDEGLVVQSEIQSPTGKHKVKAFAVTDVKVETE